MPGSGRNVVHFSPIETFHQPQDNSLARHWPAYIARSSSMPPKTYRSFSVCATRLQEEPKSSAPLLIRRLEQLAEENGGAGSKDALPYVKPGSLEFEKLRNRLEQLKFDAQYSKEVSYNKIPLYVNQESKKIALDQPWTGQESVADASLRMLVDAHKPLKLPRGAAKKPRPVSRSEAVQTRLLNAREGSLDYSLLKLSDKSKSDHDDGWTEMYRERLLGVELLGPTSISSTMNSIKALADRRIEDAKARGEFDNLPNRGKPLARDSHAESPYIDTTEYHLNNILKRQDIVPPWIEKQGSVLQVIRSFRADLDQVWLKRAVLVISERHLGLDVAGKLQKATEYAELELLNTVEARTRLLRDPDWVQENHSYLESKINSLNDTIRGYNLQAPLASQKLYLVKEKELVLMYERSSRQLHSRMKVFLLGEEKPVRQIRPGVYLGWDELPQREQLPQRELESLGEMFMNMFRRRGRG